MALSTANDNHGKSYVQRFWEAPDTSNFHWASTVFGGPQGDGFLDFAVRCQLHPYLERKLGCVKLDPVEVSALLNTSVSSSIFAPGLGDAPSCNHDTPNSRIIKLLLEKGGIPDRVVHNESIFESLEYSHMGSQVEQQELAGLLQLHRAKKVSFHEKGQHLGGWNEQPNEHTNDSSETGMQRAKSAASNLFQKMTKQKPPPNRKSVHLYSARADFRSVDALFNFRMHDDDDDD
ncbi:hypothetical protein F5882DRAFT_471833 [Hyaloscypha sp. PMI_1271]|nr:hypothetical protein F5882DRAFT_471833 [Hyaloscypha sp. PMI_1271]